MEAKDYMTRLVSGVFLVWFLGSVIAITIFKEKWIQIVIFGQMFLGAGIVAFIVGVVDGKIQPFPLLFVIIGFGVMSFGSSLRHEGSMVDGYAINKLPYYILGLFTIVGVAVIILANYYYFQMKAKCSYEVSGECIDYRLDKLPDGDEIYFPIYEIYFKGEKRTISPNMTGSGAPGMGEERTLLINPSNPDEVIDPSSLRRIQLLASLIGIVFVIVGLVGLLFVAKEMN